MHEKELEQQRHEFLLKQAAFQDSDSDEDEEELLEDVPEMGTMLDDESLNRKDAPEVNTNGSTWGDSSQNNGITLPNAINETKHEMKMRLRSERIVDQRKHVKEIIMKKRAEFAAKIDEELMVSTVETLLEITCANLEIAEHSNALSFFELLNTRQHGLERMQQDLIMNQVESDNINAAAKKKLAFAVECIARCEKSERDLAGAIVREKNDEMAMIKTVRETEMMDSEVLHQRCQRFKTNFLAGELHRLGTNSICNKSRRLINFCRKYFHSLIQMLVNRVLTVVGEREMLLVSEKTQKLDAEGAQKLSQVSKVWRNHTRSNRLRLRYVNSIEFTENYMTQTIHMKGDRSLRSLCSENTVKVS